MKMDVALEEVKAEIAATKAKIDKAENEKKDELVLKLTDLLLKLQDKENLLLGQKAATGMIRPYSSYKYKYCHIFIYIFFISLSE